MVFSIPAYAESNDYQSKYDTIAHEILELESEVPGMASPNYKLLDAMIDDVKHSLAVQPPYSKEDAISTLQKIALVLHEKHFMPGEKILLTETCT